MNLFYQILFFFQKMDLYSTCVVISIFGQNEKSELSAVLCEKREKEEPRSCRFPRRISFHRKFVIEKRVKEHSARTLQKTFVRLSLHLLLGTKLTCISHSGYKINYMSLFRKNDISCCTYLIVLRIFMKIQDLFTQIQVFYLIRCYRGRTICECQMKSESSYKFVPSPKHSGKKCQIMSNLCPLENSN